MTADFNTLNVGSPTRAAHVHRSLNTTRALADPGYAHAVISQYAHHKLGRGRNKPQVQAKLEGLEREMPHFANTFCTVRDELGLAPSRVVSRRPSGAGEQVHTVAVAASTAQPASIAPLLEVPPPPPYRGKECSCECTCGASRDRQAGPGERLGESSRSRSGSDSSDSSGNETSPTNSLLSLHAVPHVLMATRDRSESNASG
ncbi:uncharacterized protein EHS24_003927 [Apiotrichum porosum]|uniref:Uncharacterized protein n=1 Tax=Apiotrichum porosum TaxID=105984 RepID=A0A427XDT7_9TREE|nr:uncharacterized protein EHS24_003927 [Apiotrichum porosum]RSH76988.1 hypothetical protein EHS24_003927 [Apiotrichum porosum]